MKRLYILLFLLTFITAALEAKNIDACLLKSKDFFNEKEYDNYYYVNR